MRKTTIMIIPDGSTATKNYQVPVPLIRAALGLIILGAISAGYLFFDYSELRAIRSRYYQMTTENEGLKGEARILMNNLDEVKLSLLRVKDYTDKLGELTAIRVKKVAKKTGIGPLSEEEYKKINHGVESSFTGGYLPIGLNVNNLAFRPVFDRLRYIGDSANHHALELQKLLSTLSQQKSLLSSIPSISPVNGWITSGFGYRVSPFTGKKTMHKGLDVASPIGTPIFSPADGVVIFTGAKIGFGNFIMVAHGYGIVSRYGHIAENLVQPGQRVKRGEQIATVGMTGRTTGPHLHYEVVVNGHNHNPKKFILNLSDDWLAY